MEGIERIEKQVLELNNYNVLKIFTYLKTKKELYKNFNNEEKSIKQMYDFICDKAEKQKVGRVAMIDDKVVYLWAVMYFIKSNEELGLNKQETITPPTKPTKVEQKKETKKENNNQISLFSEVNK